MIDVYKVGVSLVLESNAARETSAIAKNFRILDDVIKATQRSVNELAASMRAIGRIGATAAREWTHAASSMERTANAASRAAAAMRGAGAAGFAAGAGGGGGGDEGGGGRRRSSSQPGPPAGLLSYYGPSNGSMSPYVQPGVPAPYVNPSRGFGLSGAPYTPYGGYGSGRPGPGPRQALVPYMAPADRNGFTLSGDPWTVPGSTPGRGGPLSVIPPVPPEPAGADARFMGGERYTLDVRDPKNGARRRHGHTSMADIFVTDYLGKEGVESVFEPTFEEGRVEARLRGMNMPADKIKQAYDEARRVRKEVHGSNVISNLEIAGLAMSMTQNPDEAIALESPFAKLQVALNGLKDGYGNQTIANLYTAMRSGDYHGELVSTDPKTGKQTLDVPKLEKWLHFMTAVAYTSHNTAGVDQVYHTLVAGGPEGRIIDERNIAKSIAQIQAMGPSRTGTGLMAMGDQFNAGKMAEATYAFLAEMGIVSSDPRTYKHVPIGRIFMKPGAMPAWEREEAAYQPNDFFDNVLLPRVKSFAAKKYGAQWTMPGASDEDRAKRQAVLIQGVIGMISSRDPMGRLLVDYFSTQPQQIRDVNSVAKILGVDPKTWKPNGKPHLDEYQNQEDNNPVVKIQALMASWQDFMITIGKANLQPAIKTLDDISSILDKFSHFAEGHPTQTRVMLDSLVGGLVAFNVVMAGKGIFGAGSALLHIGKGISEMEGPLGSLTKKGSLIAVAIGLNQLAKATTSFPKWLIDMATGAAIGATVAGAPGAVVGAAAGAGIHIVSTPMPPFDVDKHKGESWEQRYIGLHMPPWLDGSTAASKTVMPPGSGSVMRVHVDNQVDTRVVNGRDIADGTVKHIVKQSNAPQSGYTGTDLRMDPFGAGFGWAP